MANVEFRLGEIERLPVADGEVDVILSNCVVNLVPDKAVVMFGTRDLDPGEGPALARTEIVRLSASATRASAASARQ